MAQVAVTANATRHAVNAGKYAAAPRKVAVRGVTYNITAHGTATAATAAGKSGKPTVMAAVCVAAQAAIAANGGAAVTGVQIVAQMVGNATVVGMLRLCRATQYLANGKACPAWCSGYVAGAARSGHGLLAAVK